MKFSEYNSPWYLKGAHVQTIVPTIFRNTRVAYKRERIFTPDKDFLDLDWITSESDSVCIICHGLEGSSNAGYVKSIAKKIFEQNINVVAMNYRGCSGEINLATRYYHSGSTDDVQTVINHVLSLHQYRNIFLVGFSIGGNLVLKLAGDLGLSISGLVKKIVSVSCPVDLQSSAKVLDKKANRIYLNRFLNSLKPKVIAKLNRLPFRLTTENIKQWKTFYEFDSYYTAPMYGFASAEDYWQQASSKPVLKNISVPTLFISALNDPFLDEPCFPIEESKQNSKIKLLLTKEGGHVGFTQSIFSQQYYYEKETLNFLKLD